MEIGDIIVGFVEDPHYIHAIGNFWSEKFKNECVTIYGYGEYFFDIKKNAELIKTLENSTIKIYEINEDQLEEKTNTNLYHPHPLRFVYDQPVGLFLGNILKLNFNILFGIFTASYSHCVYYINLLTINGENVWVSVT